jgi:hypothetical protein
LKREAKYKHIAIINRPKGIIAAFTLSILLSISPSINAQQEIIISGKGTDPLLNNVGVPEQVYEAWQGTKLLDIDTSDVNGNYELKIFSDGVIITTNVGNEYELSSNYPEPYSVQTKLDLVIPDYTTIKIDIFNILGQRVGRQLSFSVFPGNFWLDIKGLFTNGIYFVRVISPEHSMVEKTIRLGEYSNISTSQLNKQLQDNSYSEPSIKLTRVSSIQQMNKVLEELNIKVRSIGLIQYKDDEVTTTFSSKILNFVRIRI